MTPTPEELVALYHELPIGELRLEDLPQPLQDEIFIRDANILINNGILSVRDVLYALVTEVWTDGVVPTYD